jgi:hypothetical protein
LIKNADPIEPLDLSSPIKLSTKKGQENLDAEGKRSLISKEDEDNDTQLDTEMTKEQNIKEIKQIANNHYECDDLEKGRCRYPMDINTTDEDYYSEFDIDDCESFTTERRKNKEAIENQMREIDSLENKDIEGDSIIVEQFTDFMRNKIHKDENVEGFSKITEPTTINCYAGILRKDVLSAFHKLCSPFDARWLLDCKTTKICRFDGEERLHVSATEPIYVTSRVLQEALERYKGNSNAGTKKKQIIGTFRQLMDFVELHFTLKLNAFGIDVLNRIQAYHTGVKTFIKATSQ